MRRVLAVAALAYLLCGAGAAQDTSQGLLALIPRGAFAAAHLNFDPATPSMTALKSGSASRLVAPEDIYDALSRLASVAGLSIDLKADVMETLGPRVLIALGPPVKGRAAPAVTVIAQAKDPKRAVDAIAGIVRAAARNDSEETVPKGDSLLHVLKSPDGKVHAAYAVMPDLVVVSTSEESAADVLEGRVQGKESLLAKQLAGQLDSLVAFCARPGVHGQAAPGAGAAPAGLPSLITGALSATDDGMQMDLVASFEGEKPEGLPAVLASLPPVKGEALKAIPPGSLAVVAVGSPGAIVQIGKQLEGLPGVGKQLAEISQMLSPITGLLSNDAAFALRSLVPKPSWVGVLAGQDEMTLTQQVSQLVDMLGSFGGQQVQETKAGDYILRLLMADAGKGTPKAVLAQTGRHFVVAADRRSAEEALDCASGRSVGAAASENFSMVRNHLPADARLIAYVDLRPIAGAGGLLSALTMAGTPAGAKMRELFGAMKGIGVGVTADQRDVKARVFVGIPPAKAGGGMFVPAVVLGAGVAMPVLAQAKERARQATCLSNMKQLSIAMLNYAHDWDGKLPPASRWRSALLPYAKNEGVFRCPSDKDKRHLSSYAMNRRLSERAVSQVIRPAETVMLFETSAGEDNPSDEGQSLAPRHSGKAGVAYVDGHVMLVQSVSPDAWGQFRPSLPPKAPAPPAKPKPRTRR